MCKLMIIPQVKDKIQALKFMRAARIDFTREDNDGVGYAALTDKGLFGERWLKVNDAFKKRITTPIKGHNLFAKIGEALKGYSEKGNYNSFGVDGDKWYSVIYHSRMATCGVSIENTHPFVKGDIALIHNGVISEAPKEWAPKQSSCDSEQIINGYDAVNVVNEPMKIAKLADDLSGYYALGVLAKQQDGRWILDVVRDSKASLSATYVAELDTIVFCTDKEIVYEACKLLKWHAGDSFDVKEDSLIRFNAITGEPMELIEFESFQQTYNTVSSVKSKEWKGFNYDLAMRDRSELSEQELEELQSMEDDEDDCELDTEYRERLGLENFIENPSNEDVNGIERKLELSNIIKYGSHKNWR